MRFKLMTGCSAQQQGLRRRGLASVAVFLVLSLVGSSMALADELLVDGDALTSATSMNLGNVCLGNSKDGTAILAMKRTQTSAPQIFLNGSTPIVTAVVTPSNPSVSAAMTDNGITVPVGWSGQAENTVSADTATSKVTITAAAPTGAKSATIAYTALGKNNQNNNDLTRSATLAVSWTVVACDTTPPVIVPNVAGTLGLDGWYRSNVTVTWTVTDLESTVSSPACGPTTISNDTAGQVVTCSATSLGGTASQSVTVKRDTTAPSVSASSSPEPTSYGWNKGPVTVTYSATDAGSGIAIDGCTLPVVVSAEGLNPPVSGSCTDKAGNTGSVTKSDIQIDTVAPLVSASASPAANLAGWNKGPVTVNFTATDTGSGIAIDGCALPVILSADGTNLSATGSCADKAGNTASATKSGIKIDTIAPLVSASTSPIPNLNGWNKGPVTVNFTATDDGSGIAVDGCDVPVILSGQGSDLSATGSCTDNAGNTASATKSGIKIDTVAPTITGATTTLPNLKGWFKNSVDVAFECSDLTSGVNECGPNQTLTDDGSPLSVTGNATDNAGNTASAIVAGIKIDTVDPTITGATTTMPNDKGWFKNNVVVAFECSDVTSGVDVCAPNQTLTIDGWDLAVTGNATDNAGNTASAIVAGINIDTVDPTITGATTTLPNLKGWFKSNVVVAFECTDDRSGIDVCAPNQILTANGSALAVTGYATDNAGNTKSATVGGIKIDTIAPSVSASASPGPNSYGWNKGPVTVSFSGTDTGSGIAVDACDEPVIVPGDGSDLSATGSCIDNAGNSASTTKSGIKIDTVAPSVSLVGGPQHGQNYYFGAVTGTPTCIASDDRSGLAGACEVTGYSASVGTHTVSARATDNAGNVTTATATYTVDAWTLKGFFAPVDMGFLNTVKGGSTVPLKFRIFAGSTELTDTLTTIKSLTAVTMMCPGTETPIAPVEELAPTGGTVLRYDATGGQFIYNWKTLKNPGKCYRVTMTAQDGSKISAEFKLT